MAVNIPRNKTEYIKHVLGRNPRVSHSVVAQSQELEASLKKLGVEVQPQYTLSPPLGDSVRQIHNRDKRETKRDRTKQ